MQHSARDAPAGKLGRPGSESFTMVKSFHPVENGIVELRLWDASEVQRLSHVDFQFTIFLDSLFRRKVEMAWPQFFVNKIDE